MLLLRSVILCLIIILCLVIFIIQRNHLLISLIALERVILVLVLGVIFNRGVGLEVFIIFTILCFAACEARLGLSCLVSIVRFLGSDSFYLFNSVKS